MATALSGIFYNGVAGMLANTQAMGTISDNIANQNTVGYKRVETNFATLLGRQETAIQGAGFESHLVARNTSGVRASTRQLVDVQGAIQTTGRPYDLAISGGGMFLFASATASGDELTFEEDDIVYSRAGDLNQLIPMDLSGTTVTASVNAFLANKNGQYLLAQPYTADDLAAGVTTPTGDLTTVQVNNQEGFAGQATTTASLAAVIPASGATSVSTPIFYVDDAGEQQGLTLEFSNPVVVANTSTTWDVTVYDADGVAVTGPLAGGAVFDSTGQLTTGSPLTVTAGATTFALDMSDVAMLGDATITGSGNQAVQVGYEQDGVPAGAFTGLTIRGDGVIFGNYAGGATQPLYRIPIVTFANPNALEQLAGNVYGLTEGAGEPELRFLGDTFARLEVNAVETSNVDLADQFSQMIITQRAYGSSAKVISTADEMSVVARDLI